MNVRPFQDTDAPAVARLVTDGVRGHWTYAPEQFRESRDPARLRLVAERGGEVVATAHLHPFGPATPDALRLDFAGEGEAFSALYLALLARLPAGFTRLLGVTREDWPETMHFFHAAGFRNAWQSWGAHLDLRGFDFGRFRPLEERLYLAGYEVERLAADAPDADWAALYTLYRLGLEDAPRNPTTTPDPLTLEELRATARREEAAFVTRLRGEIVASTRLRKNCGESETNPTEGSSKKYRLAAMEERPVVCPDVLESGHVGMTLRGTIVDSEHTVTARVHRGHGLATALKAHALAWAQAGGHVEASTGGTVLNLPMLRVNTRLGYVPEAMWITWERRP